MTTNPRHVLLTGQPGVGKSTLVQAVGRRLGLSVRSVGFTTEEQCNTHGERSGFRTVDVSDSSHTLQLATVDPSAPEDCKVGPFRVHVESWTAFVRESFVPLTNSCEADDRPVLVFLDEVGAMQLLSPEAAELLAQMFNTVATVLGTIPPRGLHELAIVEDLRIRHDVAVVEVTEANRNCLLNTICNKLRGTLFSAEVVRQIQTKEALAVRYQSELDDRMLCKEVGKAWAFRGDHGTYNLRRFHLPVAHFTCTCPFFLRWSTCSHTLALAMQAEQSRRGNIMAVGTLGELSKELVVVLRHAKVGNCLTAAVDAIAEESLITGDPKSHLQLAPALLLADLNLASLPQDFGANFCFSSVTEVDLSGNVLVSLPDKFFASLTQLTVLLLGGPPNDLRSNRLTALPESLGNLTSLKQLSLHDNLLEHLPKQLSCCVSLCDMRLDRNPLRSLPPLPRSLRTLHLEGCPLPGSMDCLCSLPTEVLALADIEDLQLPDGCHVGSFFGTPFPVLNLH